MRMDRSLRRTAGRRLCWISVVLLGTLFFTASANAVEFSVIGNSTATVTWGEIITINFVMTNNTDTPVFGIAASVHGYNADDVTFLGGSAVPNYLNQICVAPGACFGGLQNLVGGSDLVESEIGDNGPRVQFALSAGLSPVTGIPGVDQGLDNTVSSVMFSLSFIIHRPCSNFLIDTSYQGDGVIVEGGQTMQAQGSTFSTAICPEPGTALLMGLGLAGLSASSPRHRNILETRPAS